MLTNKATADKSLNVNRFSIAHISDLHIAEIPNIPGWHQSAGLLARLGVGLQLLRRRHGGPTMTSHDDRCARALLDVLAGQNRHRPRGYDACIVTGDLATTGSFEDLTAAAALLRGDPSAAGAETLRRKSALPPMVVLPGNHDRYNGAALLPSSANFENGSLFGGNWDIANPKHSAKRSHVNSSIITNAHGKKLAVVTGDFSYVRLTPMLPRYVGGGKARTETLREMERVTAQFAKEGLPVIWAVHYPPVKKGVDWFLYLSGHKAVLKVANRRNIEVILSGHTHKQRVWRIAQPNKITPIQVVCAGSACEFARGGTHDRTFYELQVEVQQGRARLASAPLPMIYSAWQERIQVGGRLGVGAEFCPAP